MRSAGTASPAARGAGRDAAAPAGRARAARLFLAGAVVLLAFRLFWMYLAPSWSTIATDFPNYYTSAWMAVHGRPLADLYDPVAFDRERRRAGIDTQVALFNFPPPSALIMVPLANLDPLAARRLWLVANLGLLVGLVAAVARLARLGWLPVALVALLGGDALGANFAYGQFYLVLAALLVAGAAWAARRPALAGAALAAAILTKLFPALFAVYLAATRRWRALAWTGLAAALLGAASLAWLGAAPFRVFAGEVAPRLLAGEFQDPYNVRLNTWPALLRRALVEEPSFNPAPIADLPLLFFFLRVFLTGAVLLVTFGVLAGRRRAPVLVEYGLVLAAFALVTPHQSSYHQVLLFPAIAGAVAATADMRLRALWIGAYALISSNVMGATSAYASGWWMLAAFPRAYLWLLLWAGFAALAAGGARRLWPRVGKLRPAAAFAGLAVMAAGAAFADAARWERHGQDGARMVDAATGGAFIEVDPTVGPSGLLFSALRPAGYDWIHPSASPSGIAYETARGVHVRFAGGGAVELPGGTEPAMGSGRAAAILETAGRWIVVEREAGAAGWRELFRRTAPVHDLAFAPDGTAIAFAELTGARYSIFEWSRATGAIRPLPVAGGDVRYPAYAPDGGSIAVATNARGNWDIARFEPATGRIEYLTSSPAHDLMPAWSPTGNVLFFASDRRRGYRFTKIYRLEME